MAEAVTDVGYTAVPDIRHTDLSAHFSQLVAIHAAPAWLWPALLAALLAKGWTVEHTRGQVDRVKSAAAGERPGCGKGGARCEKRAERSLCRISGTAAFCTLPTLTFSNFAASG